MKNDDTNHRFNCVYRHYYLALYDVDTFIWYNSIRDNCPHNFFFKWMLVFSSVCLVFTDVPNPTFACSRERERLGTKWVTDLHTCEIKCVKWTITDNIGCYVHFICHTSRQRPNKY